MMEAFMKLAMVALMLAALATCNGQTICNMSSEELMACKPSVSPPNPAPPSAVCCSAISHADIRCLCTYRNSKVLPSLGIDPKLALQLPKKCKVPNPPHC